MTTYRWNVSDFAAGYDAAAAQIHPHYEELQATIVDLLPLGPGECGTIVDLGGGSGRLAEKLLAHFPSATVVVLDQSEPFLALAERRLARFGNRGRCVLARLQDDWPAALAASGIAGPVRAFVSMSAIHHLEPAQKRTLYERCQQVLAPGGVLLNADEVRPDDETHYLALLQQWGEHMQRLIAARSVPASMESALRQWMVRNLDRFAEPRHTGDDCHESVATQLGYFIQSDFATADAPWQRALWAVLRGTKC